MLGYCPVYNPSGYMQDGPLYNTFRCSSLLTGTVLRPGGYTQVHSVYNISQKTFISRSRRHLFMISYGIRAKKWENSVKGRRVGMYKNIY